MDAPADDRLAALLAQLSITTHGTAIEFKENVICFAPPDDVDVLDFVFLIQKYLTHKHIETVLRFGNLVIQNTERQNKTAQKAAAELDNLFDLSSCMHPDFYKQLILSIPGFAINEGVAKFSLDDRGTFFAVGTPSCFALLNAGDAGFVALDVGAQPDARKALKSLGLKTGGGKLQLVSITNNPHKSGLCHQLALVAVVGTYFLENKLKIRKSGLKMFEAGLASRLHEYNALDYETRARLEGLQSVSLPPARLIEVPTYTPRF